MNILEKTKIYCPRRDSNPAPFSPVALSLRLIRPTTQYCHPLIYIPFSF